MENVIVRNKTTNIIGSLIPDKFSFTRWCVAVGDEEMWDDIKNWEVVRKSA